MKKIFFHFPAFDAFVSGGNIYNKKLVEVLLGKGNCIQVNNHLLADWIISDTIYLNQPKEQILLKQSTAKKAIIIHHLQYFDDPTVLKEFELLHPFDLLIANSQFTAQNLLNKGINKNKIIIIEPPVTANVSRVKVFPNFPIQAIMVGNWIDRKGYLELLTVLKNTSIQPSNLSISIYGDHQLDENYLQQCQQMIQQHNILQKIIHSKGSLHEVDLLKSYPKHNLFITTSKMETYGMAIKEALYAGLFVLALDRGNIPYLLKNNQQGKLFNNLQQLVDYLFELSEQPAMFKNLVESLNHSTRSPETNFQIQIEHFVNSILI